MRNEVLDRVWIEYLSEYRFRNYYGFMAERVGCAQSLRSLRLPPVAEPIPLLTSGKGSHPLIVPQLIRQAFPHKSHAFVMAERVGFEPTSPCGRTGFRDRRLKPTRQPLQLMIAQYLGLCASPTALRAGGWDVLASLPPPPFGRRTHVHLWENPGL
jgi:hypothetical protein